MSAKNLIYCIFFVCSKLIASNILSTTQPPNHFKINAKSSDLYLVENGMYYCTQAQMIPISEVKFANGLYTVMIDRGIAEDIFGVWWCANCQRWNSRFDSACVYCYSPR